MGKTVQKLLRITPAMAAEIRRLRFARQDNAEADTIRAIIEAGIAALDTQEKTDA